MWTSEEDAENWFPLHTQGCSSSILPIKQSGGQPQGNLTSLKEDHGFPVSGLELATGQELDFRIICSWAQKRWCSLFLLCYLRFCFAYKSLRLREIIGTFQTSCVSLCKLGAPVLYCIEHKNSFLLELSLLKVFIIVINIGLLKCCLILFFFFGSRVRTQGNQCTLHFTQTHSFMWLLNMQDGNLRVQGLRQPF